jgi:hypothetical protein
MHKQVISENLINLLNNRKVLAGVFTTYTFELDFFELDVIPILLDSGIAFSSDDRVKTFQVREALRESGLELEIFYDLPIFRQSAETSPNMEYLCHGVKHHGGAFHAKNIYLLVQDSAEIKSLMFAAGSNNLTRAGWWENIEVQHWVEINQAQNANNLLTQLKADIEYLSALPSCFKDNYALNNIQNYLESITGDGTPVKENVFYFGLRDGSNFNEYLGSIHEKTLGLNTHWTLEIISPFFAENNENELHKVFLELFNVENITLFLPQDQEGTALCEPAYYSYIKKSDHIGWGKWNPEITPSLGMSGNLFRRTHAKIFHFYNAQQAWVFIGSVNLSHKAMHDNVESGFLVKLDHVEPLLAAFSDDKENLKFSINLEHETNPDENQQQEKLPELHLRYDWIKHELTGRTVAAQQFQINIKNPEGKFVVSDWLIKEQEEIYRHDLNELTDILQQGSLVLVSGKNVLNNTIFQEHKVMLQQTGWSHKPINLPSLTTAQILAIYVGMSPERRQIMLMNAEIKSLVLNHACGEMTDYKDEPLHEQFFCEYAEIFHAFRTLKNRLFALENTDKQLDYYLTGCGVDSLPALINQSNQDMDKNDAVRNYLLLLSAKELYGNDKFKSRANVADQLNRVETALSSLKSGNAITLEDNSPKKRKKFFTWFEAQFSKQYIVKTHEGML